MTIRNILIAGILLAGASTSCKKNVDSESNCLLPSRTESITLKLNKFNSSFETTTYRRNESDDPYSCATLPRQDLDLISESFDLKDSNRPTVAIFLIVKDSIRTVTKNSILKIVHYQFHKGQYLVQAYSHMNASVIPEQRVDFKTLKILSNTAYFLKEESRSADSDAPLRVVQILADDLSQLHINRNKEDEFQQHWLKLNASNYAKTSGPIFNNTYCPQPCGGPIGTECIQYNENDPRDMYCPSEEKHIVCFRNTIRDEVSSTINAMLLEGIYSDSLHYGFRDNFLSKYSSGIDYIVDYYTFSSILSDTIVPQELVLKTHDALKILNSCIWRINQNASDTILTESEAAEFTALIQHYRPLSNKAKYQSILDKVQYDITQFKGLRRETLLSKL